MPGQNVAVLVGSLRRDSINRKLARALVLLAPKDLNLNVVDLALLPFYNPDLDGQPPTPWVDFRDQLRASDAVLFITPEYNRSVPAVLKNAIDVASRPYGQSVLNGKPAAVISASPGMLGGFGANHHLRQSLVFLNMPTLPQPEVYLSGADKIFDADGRLENSETRAYLFKFLEAFAIWVRRFENA